MLSNSLLLVGVGFGLGLLHAFDADHVMAVSALSAEKPGMRRLLRLGGCWALGHAGLLLVAGALLFGLGLALPEALVQLAEAAVGVMLVALGLWCLWQLRRQGARLTVHRHVRYRHIRDSHAMHKPQRVATALHAHRHDGLPHMHWHTEDHTRQPLHRDTHKPVLIGMLHGLAGSAPALALVPSLAQGQVLLALTYLLLFSLGVMLAMLGFGVVLGGVQQQLQRRSLRLLQGLRYSVAVAAVGLGSFWLMQAL